ncbi:hypothetical protein ATY75_08400 [Rhizobium sp. N122]|nr:hypothetical protein ATY75_08400 [Rhizobium sp. N122]
MQSLLGSRSNQVKGLFAACLSVFAADAGNASEVPFTATRNVPDYTASMIVRNSYSEPKEYSRSVFHRKGWTRVEDVRGEITILNYGNFFDNVRLGTSRVGDQDFTSVDISKSRRNPRVSVEEAKETRDGDSHAGEACKWWQLIRNDSEEVTGPFLFSCLTVDGIQIAEKELLRDRKPMSEIQLIKLERAPVSQSEVSPPKRLFDPWFWLKPLRDYPENSRAIVDFEVRMIGELSEMRILRHYPWRLEERRAEDGSLHFIVWNELENQGISVASSERGHFLQAERSPLDPKWPGSRFRDETDDVDLKQNDTVLGEPCAWFDLMPNTADAGRKECLTPDGVALKIDITSGWTRGDNYTAVEIKRRPVELKEMIPPTELIDASSWGFTVSD